MQKRNILIVEDEIIIAREIEKRLSGLGYNVVDIAVTGEEAMNKTEEFKPDLILMDIIIKGKKNGIETAQEIKKMYDIPIVFLTAHSDENTVQRARAVNSYGYILKPIQDNTFLIVIDHAFYKHQSEKIVVESRNWLTAILNSISEGVIAVDNEGLVRLMNPVAESLTGWNQNEAFRKELSEIFKKTNSESFSDKNKNDVLPDISSIIKQENMEKKAVLTDKSGKQIPISYKVDLINDDSNDTIGEVIVFKKTDLT